MKHFIDIERVKRDTQDDIVMDNTYCFEVGDDIVIQEKVDGSNASFRYDESTDSLVAFSRKKELNYSNTLNGYWNFVQSLDKNLFKKYPNYVFFMEWLTSHTIKYKKEAYRKSYFYDVFDLETDCYLPQSEVKRLAEELGLNYVKTYYVGKFISWEHCMSFMDRQSDISDGVQEGVVIKNQTKLNTKDDKKPFVLKLVNSQFSEIQKNRHIKKVLDPNKEEEKSKAKEIVEKIVTKERVRKEILKMIDENVIPKDLQSKDMSTIAKILPKRIYEDCVKEEKEYVEECGEYFGKFSNSTTMKFAKEIILQ